MNPTIERDVPDFVFLLQATARFLWKRWPMDIELAHFDESRFVFRGTCPHCGHKTNFPTITNYHMEMRSSMAHRIIAAARCIGCREYILAIVKTDDNRNSGNYGTWIYEAHYPLGKPQEELPDGIPDGIAGDFKEALRCQFVEAYSATAEMCRRAIEASCLDLGAPYNEVLEDMIDWLEEKRIITPILKEVAHKVRLGGNRGAHPWKVGQPVAKPIPVIVIEKEHAEAIVNFSVHFLQHVYVIPNQLPKFDFNKPKLDKNP
jgi:hypothetical protein